MINPMLCAWCGQRCARTDFYMQIDSPSTGAAVILWWHETPTGAACVDADPEAQALVNAEGAFDVSRPAGERAVGGTLDVAPDADDVCLSAYMTIHARVLERGPATLRATIDVKRDHREATFTLRGPGEYWGRQVRVKAAPPRVGGRRGATGNRPPLSRQLKAARRRR